MSLPVFSSSRTAFLSTSGSNVANNDFVRASGSAVSSPVLSAWQNFCTSSSPLSAAAHSSISRNDVVSLFKVAHLGALLSGTSDLLPCPWPARKSRPSALYGPTPAITNEARQPGSRAAQARECGPVSRIFSASIMLRPAICSHA